MKIGLYWSLGHRGDRNTSRSSFGGVCRLGVWSNRQFEAGADDSPLITIEMPELLGLCWLQDGPCASTMLKLLGRLRTQAVALADTD